ncbi:MAG: hypothetical protein Q8Q40_10015 [Methylococcaceae bacterium]|nr:hypothetical protein [Methylococcaceae bacterium]MDP3904299.1 hypothetical protein [Methylococcaceae bacterium]
MSWFITKINSSFACRDRQRRINGDFDGIADITQRSSDVVLFGEVRLIVQQ